MGHGGAPGLRLSPATADRYGREVRYLHTWLEEQGVTAVPAITAIQLRQYLLHLSQTRNPDGQHIA